MKIFLISLTSILVIIAVVLILVLGSSPKFDSEYFDSAYLQKYSSPVDLYQTYLSFLKSGDRHLWEEMIGRKLKENEESPKLVYRGLPPSIQEYRVERGQAVIVTSDGMKIEMEFIKDRWVLSQKTPGFYFRKLITNIKAFFGNIFKKFQEEKPEKITVPSQ